MFFHLVFDAALFGAGYGTHMYRKWRARHPRQENS